MIFKGCQLLKLPWPISTKIHHLFYDYRANCFTNGRPKTARSMLSDRCPACLFSVLSVTLVYCGQTVGRMMKLGMEVGLGPRLHCVIDGDPAPPPKGHPQYSAHVRCGQTAGWIEMPLGTEVCLGPGDIVLDGDPAPPPQRDNLLFLAHVYCTKRLDGSRCQTHLVQRFPR